MGDEPRDEPIVKVMARVMAEVRAVGKGDKNTFHNFFFRGIDRILDNVGPALRAHGVVPTPSLLTLESRDTKTEKNKTAREITVWVKYTFHGPAGDSMECIVPGEAQDTGDKAVSKAMAVAYRTALIQVLAIPTRELDPDARSYERTSTDGGPSVTELKRSIWAAAQERGWIAEDDTYEELTQDFALWRAQGDEPVIELADADSETLTAYLAFLKPKTRMSRTRTRTAQS
ncbi:hypothetical protein GCM10022243_49270 [Saccharothrix violaceirubra]|uniref:ERF superfamily protein n=1 Tax=Saccharothrix violaceirubra TaxID=413306 RepID=A0A7W7SZB1_9PSEU|nr:ERF family protein [Saccharothrix violaceirubra]MBB4963729.1 hypothetical protein [Saccharothrix violaceirubra]